MKPDQVEAVTAKMTEPGGVAAESFEVDDEIVEEAVAAAEEEPVEAESA